MESLRGNFFLILNLLKVSNLALTWTISTYISHSCRKLFNSGTSNLPHLLFILLGNYSSMILSESRGRYHPTDEGYFTKEIFVLNTKMRRVVYSSNY